MNRLLNTKEHRQFPRVDFHEPVECTLLPQEEGNGWENRGLAACDISEGGLKFYTTDFIPLHKAVRLSFYIRAQQHIALSGKVVWVQKMPHSDNYQVGLKFDDAVSDPLAQKHLQEFLEP